MLSRWEHPQKALNDVGLAKEAPPSQASALLGPSLEEAAFQLALARQTGFSAQQIGLQSSPPVGLFVWSTHPSKEGANQL